MRNSCRRVTHFQFGNSLWLLPYRPAVLFLKEGLRSDKCFWHRVPFKSLQQSVFKYLFYPHLALSEYPSKMSKSGEVFHLYGIGNQ